MKNIILTLIITLPLTLLSQGWEQTYSFVEIEESDFVKPTDDGGFIFTGCSKPQCHEVLLIKTNSFGDTVWIRSYEININNFNVTDVSAESVVESEDGGFIILGDWNDEGQVYYGGSFIIKTDEYGLLVSLKNLGLDNYGNHLEKTSDNGFIITGYKIDNDYFYTTLNKYTYNGDLEWSKTYYEINSYNDDMGICVQENNDGGFIISTIEGALIKTNNIGDTLWTKKNYNSYVRQADDNGFILTTHNELIKLDENGLEEWAYIYNESVYGRCVQITNDNGYIICGTKQSPQNDDTSGRDIYVIKTNLVGDTLWTKKYGNNFR